MAEFRTSALTLTAMVLAWGAAGAVQPPAGPTGATPAGWEVHSEAAFRFAVAYPAADLGILPEASAPQDGAVKRLRFQDRQILSGQFAELEPPRLTVEVFSRASASTSLTDWLRSTGRLPQGATATKMTMAGADDGLQVRLAQQFAPNTTCYFASGPFVYALTPLGAFSSEMFASFRLL